VRRSVQALARGAPDKCLAQVGSDLVGLADGVRQ
jgi:hypothetical protein